jgi:proline iminopeptidase
VPTDRDVRGGLSERFVVADDGVTLWTVRSGGDSREPLVLCHGGPGLWDELEPVASMLDDLVDVVRWDQRGAGRSDPRGPYSIARSIADLECIRASLGKDRVVIGGHSWGAALALRYAIRHPSRVRALLYVSGIDLDWKRHREKYRAERLRRLGPHRARWEELRRTGGDRRELFRLGWSTDFADRERALDLADRWGYDRFTINGEANAAINAESDAEDGAELAASCRALMSETLVIHGAADPRPLDGPRELAATLPNARLAVLEGVGHVPWAEHPELLRAELRAFVAR